MIYIVFISPLSFFILRIPPQVCFVLKRLLNMHLSFPKFSQRGLQLTFHLGDMPPFSKL
jgi:hypothetical protein